MSTLFSVLLVLSASAHPAHIPLSAPPVDVAFIDIDGDGWKEVFALSQTPSEPDGKSPVELRVISVKPPSGPVTVTSSTTEASYFLSAELTGKPPKEMVALYPTHLEVLTFEDQRLVQTHRLDETTLLQARPDKPAFLGSFVADFDGDGRDEFALPTVAGYRIFSADKALFTLPVEVTHTLSSRSPLEITYHLPALEALSVGPDKKQVAGLIDDKSVVMRHGENLEEQWQRSFTVPEEEGWSSSILLKDINADKVPDIVQLKRQVKGLKARTLASVYLAQAPFSYPSVPTSELDFGETTGTPLFVDVDGDTDLDVIFLGKSLSIGTLVGILVRNKLSLDVELYLFNGHGYDAEPSGRTTFEARDLDKKSRPTMELGDFNGDGLLDLAASRTGSELGFFSGRKEGLFEEDPWATVQVSATGKAYVEDLNKNGKDDLVLMSTESAGLDIILF